MSTKQSGTSWPMSKLVKRGWTEDLVRTLLPPPRLIYQNGRRMRVWPKSVVQKQEQDPIFRAAFAANRAENTSIKADSAAVLGAAASFLQQAWESTHLSEGPIARLAGLYHSAILSQIATVGWAKRLSSGQSQSYIERFSSLDPERMGDQLYPSLRQMVTAAYWMGRHLEHESVQKLSQCYSQKLYDIADFAAASFRQAQPEGHLARLLAMEDFPLPELLVHPLQYIYSVHYVPKAIRSSLELLMELNPKDEYPEARAMRRHFVLHIGGTNTGKTYAGFQRLKAVRTGVYLAPLRLLALEAQELLLDAHVRCSLTTGEEEDCQEGDTHVAATAEKLDIHAKYDAAVVDECQMIADPARGYAWTRAILGVQAPEVHLCAAPEAQHLLVKLIESCEDSYEIVHHHRQVPLVCMSRPVNMMNLQPGDALITFSKIGVLSAAEDLRQHGKPPAIIYGALPYSTRRKQMEAFLNGEVDYVVSTDAIGMGLNLPIRRIIFMEADKFDGKERRPLKPEEIQQIAGRAGRFGMYDKGYVGATQQLSEISAGLHTTVPPLQTAVLGFSDLVLSVDFDLLEVLEEWNRMPPIPPYKKLDITRYLQLVSKIREAGFQLSKQQELRAANIPFDETEDALRDLFFEFLRQHQRGEQIEQPQLPERQSHTLPELELYCRQLDLYFSFCKTFGCVVDADEIYDERERVADEINQILLHNLRNNIRFCEKCGAALPLHHRGRLCNACYQKKINAWRYHKR